MKRKILFANWKMNKKISEAVDFIRKTKTTIDSLDKEEFIVGIASSFLCLPVLKNLGSNIIGIAQNVHFEEKGAFTGEISASMLEEIGINFVIVGHSERRQYFNETNHICNLKLKTLEKHNMNAVFCVGEKLDEYEKGETKAVIKKQIEEGLEGLSIEYVSSLIIAYEPVWAIGTGKNATSEIADEISTYILNLISEKYSSEVAEKVYILYGGSVKKDNIKEYLDCNSIDGALIGGASLEADSFLSIIRNLKE